MIFVDGEKEKVAVAKKEFPQPAMFYRWQKKLFENGAAVFDQPRRKSSRNGIAS